MTLSTSNPRAKPRWAILVGFVGALTMTAGGLALAAHGGASSIPTNYAPFTVTDQQSANDVPGQVDLTQMGRDDATASTYKLFWSWDSISAWTGQGQTGDACALFDTDNDTSINFVVCVRVENRNASPTDVTIRTSDSGQLAFAFSCSDKKSDRCTNPVPAPFTAAQIQVGALGTSPLDATANLITHTDPFPAGESHDRDSTVEVHILKSFLPENEVLVNVCSYPSAGNGGNNNPFDCIVSPGGGFLRIVKSAGPSAPNFTFSASRGASTLATFTALGTSTATVNPQPSSQTLLPLLVDPNSGANLTVTETNIPADWDLSSVTCKVPAGGSSTGSPDLTNDRIQQVSIQSGQVTECTFVDQLRTGTLVVIKNVINDNGGTATAGDFTYNLNESPDQGAFGNETAAVSPGTSYTLSAGTNFDVVENVGGPAGYTVSYGNSWDSSSDCTGTMGAGQTLTCTITNDDNEPTLRLVKTITNDNGGSAAATDWTLSADADETAPADLSGTTPVTSGTGFDVGTYNLAESGPSGYTAGSWSCVDTGTSDAATMPTTTSVTVGLGDDITCTINNDDTKAEPGGTTVQSWTLRDSLTITGIRTGALDQAAAEVTFKLYDADGCAEVDLVGTRVDSAIEYSGTTGEALTPTGIDVTLSGTYYWTAHYSGDQYNESFTTECGDEVTQILAKDAHGENGRDDFAD